MRNPRRDLLAFETDEAWGTLFGRLQGVTDDEYFWQPVPGCWTVHRDAAGKWVVDYEIDAPDPPPFTTLAWRLVHIASCKLMYHEYAFGAGRLTWDDLPYPGTASQAIDWLVENHRLLRSDLDGVSDADLDREVKTNWGDLWRMWQIFWAMICHDVHHGAEIGVLRDLYRSRPPLPD